MHTYILNTLPQSGVICDTIIIIYERLHLNKLMRKTD